ncbi:MAG: hypothetical protein GC185_08160 [Alphaproteobacteria bacterium]|nr:hypothetical protein [Alphaproteobacteria bacterium]
MSKAVLLQILTLALVNLGCFTLGRMIDAKRQKQRIIILAEALSCFAVAFCIYYITMPAHGGAISAG